MPDLSFSLRQVCQKKKSIWVSSNLRFPASSALLELASISTACGLEERPPCQTEQLIDVAWGFSRLFSSSKSASVTLTASAFRFFFFFFFFFFCSIMRQCNSSSALRDRASCLFCWSTGTHSMQQVLATHRHRRFFVSLQVASRSLFCRLTRGESHHYFPPSGVRMFLSDVPISPGEPLDKTFFLFLGHRQEPRALHHGKPRANQAPAGGDHLIQSYTWHKRDTPLRFGARSKIIKSHEVGVDLRYATLHPFWKDMDRTSGKQTSTFAVKKKEFLASILHRWNLKNVEKATILSKVSEGDPRARGWTPTHRFCEEHANQKNAA